MTGVINVYKEKGYTSHDVVAIVRKKFGRIKTGHTGTLDPQAEGVLPICLGRATKLAGYLTAQDKSYRAELILGLTTDTYDNSGTTLTTAPVDYTIQEIREAVDFFVGSYMQMPPMYSAIRVGGKRLYELAREGITIERKARQVEITRIEMKQENNRLWLDIDCSKGTYIRSLCADIGEKLGCGACMGDLLRTRSGSFTLQNAQKLSELEPSHIISVESAFPAPRLDFNGSLNMAINGNVLEYNFQAQDGHNWLYCEDKLIGLYKAKNGQLRPEVMIYENNK